MRLHLWLAPFPSSPCCMNLCCTEKLLVACIQVPCTHGGFYIANHVSFLLKGLHTSRFDKEEPAQIDICLWRKLLVIPNIEGCRCFLNICFLHSKIMVWKVSNSSLHHCKPWHNIGIPTVRYISNNDLSIPPSMATSAAMFYLYKKPFKFNFSKLSRFHHFRAF